MDTLVSVLGHLKDFSGLGVAALALFVMLKTTKKANEIGDEMVNLKENHLHEIKMCMEGINKKDDDQLQLLHDIKETLIRIETRLNGHFSIKK